MRKIPEKQGNDQGEQSLRWQALALQPKAVGGLLVCMHTYTHAQTDTQTHRHTDTSLEILPPSCLSVTGSLTRTHVHSHSPLRQESKTIPTPTQVYTRRRVLSTGVGGCAGGSTREGGDIGSLRHRMSNEVDDCISDSDIEC